MSKLAVKAPGPSTYAKNLSGGNQQKVVFAKWSHPGRGSFCWTSRPSASTSARAKKSTA